MTMALKGLLVELQDGEYFVACRYEVRDKQQTKVPVDARTGDYANVKDPSTWSSLEAAVNGAQCLAGDEAGRRLA